MKYLDNERSRLKITVIDIYNIETNVSAICQQIYGFLPGFQDLCVNTEYRRR